ncbi:hypothetical protein MK139_10360, partial [bacterium]|nr:hypothetical protein [bacterium]
AVDAQLETLEAERAKNFGIAHLEQEQPNDAAEMFRTVIDLAPEEALGYANLAATFLRLSQVDSALHWLDQANVVALSRRHTVPRAAGARHSTPSTGQSRSRRTTRSSGLLGSVRSSRLATICCVLLRRRTSHVWLLLSPKIQ